MYSTRKKSQGANSNRRLSITKLKPAGSTKGIGVSSLKKNNKMLAGALQETRSELNAYRKTLDESSKCLSQFKFARSKMLKMNSVLKSFVQEFEEVLLILNFDDSELFQAKPPMHTYRTFKDQMDKIANLPITSEESSVHEDLEYEPNVGKNENVFKEASSSEGSAKEICSQAESIHPSSKSLIPASEISRDVKEAETDEKLSQTPSPRKISKVSSLKSSTSSQLDIETKICPSTINSLHQNISSQTKITEKPPSSKILHKSKIPKVTGIPVCNAKKDKSNVLKFRPKKKLSDKGKTGTEDSGFDHTRRKTFVVKVSNSNPADVEQSSNQSKFEGNATSTNSSQLTSALINKDLNKNLTTYSASADIVETQKDIQMFTDSDSVSIAEAQKGLQMLTNGPDSNNSRRKTFVLTQKFTDSDSIGIPEAQRGLQMFTNIPDSDQSRRKTFVLKESNSHPVFVKESSSKSKLEENGNATSTNSSQLIAAIINEDLNINLTTDSNPADIVDAQKAIQTFTNSDQLTAAETNENFNKNRTTDSDSAGIAGAQRSSQMITDAPEIGIQSPSKEIFSAVSPKMNISPKIKKIIPPDINEQHFVAQMSEDAAFNKTKEIENLIKENELVHFTGAVSKHKCSDNIFVDSCNKKQKVQTSSSSELKAKKKREKKCEFSVHKNTGNYNSGTPLEDIAIDVLHHMKKVKFHNSTAQKEMLEDADWEAITHEKVKRGRKKKTKRVKEKTCSEYSENVSPGVSNHNPNKFDKVKKQRIKRKKSVSKDNKDSPFKMIDKNSFIVEAEIHQPPPHILSFDVETENQENRFEHEKQKTKDNKNFLQNRNIKNIEHVNKENKQLAGMQDQQLYVVLHDFRKLQNDDTSKVSNVKEPTSVDRDPPVKSPLSDNSLNIQKLPDKNFENIISTESHPSKLHDEDCFIVEEFMSNDPGHLVAKSKESHENEITLGKRRRKPVNYQEPKMNIKMRR